MTSSAPDRGFAAWVDVSGTTRSVLPWHAGLSPRLRALSVLDLGYALAFILALTAPVFAVGRAHVTGPLAVLGEVVAIGWFVWGLQPSMNRQAVGVARWPGATAAIGGAGALGALLAQGRPGVVLWLALWALPGFVQLVRYRVAQAALEERSQHSRFEDDRTWYSSQWRRDPENPAHAMGTEGYTLELLGGPLAGRTARLRDSRFSLWIVEGPKGHLAASGARDAPDTLPLGARLIGVYSFSHGDEAMVWTPAG